MKLKIEHGTKTLKREKVLNDVSLEFEDNKIYAIVGANGSGKTILLRALIGLLRLDDGNVYAADEVIGKDIDFLPECGIILGNMNLQSQYNAFDNLKILQSINNKFDKNEINRVLEVVGLKDNKKKVSSYSLGMHQRVVLAQAIMGEPKYLLLDEPTNGMDENYTNKVKQEIISMKKVGRIIIITSHDKYLVEEIADEIIIIKQGEIQNDEK